MSAIRDLVARAESDCSGVEGAFLGWVGSGAFYEGCGAEIVELADLLVGLGRRNLAVTILGMAYPELPAAEGIPTLKKLIRLAPSTPGLSTELVERVQTAHGSDETVRAALRASELGRKDDALKSLDRFEAFARVKVGQYVRHRGDWGVGCIRKIDPLTAAVALDFQRRPNHQMTLEGVVDLLEFIDGDSWPARKFDRLAELRRLADKEPGTLVRQLTAHFGGKMELSEIRNEMKGSVIEADKWTRWWSLAKKAAQRDPHLEVKTSGGSTTFELRDIAVSAADELREAMAKKKDLVAKWEIARSALRTYAQNDDVLVVRDLLIHEIEVCPPPKSQAEKEALVECLVFLENNGWTQAGGRLGEIAVGADEDLVARLSSKDEQRRFAQAIARTAPDGGKQVLFAALFLDGTKVRDDIRSLLPKDLVAEAESRILSDPAAHAEAFLEVMSGSWTLKTGIEADVVRAAARFGHDISRLRDLNKTTQERYIKRCREYLSNKEGERIRRYVETRSKDDVSRFASYLRRTDSLCDLYHNEIRYFEKKLPEEVRRVVKRFWEPEGESVFSTLEGIERRRKEFRHLMQVEIPDNERAIGEAAARGDLSENSEWTAAIERQKELTEKASEMREEFERARPLEEEDISTEIVSPGTRVFLKDPGTGEERIYEVLGPWDVDVEHGVLSYMSPIAKGLLGKRVGEEATIELPGLTTRLEVVAIEHFHSSPAAASPDSATKSEAS